VATLDCFVASAPRKDSLRPAGNLSRMEDQNLLAMHGISKRFTATLALDAVDFDVRAGEIHALLGQNGAGKSTLIKILAGVYPPSAGSITWRGQPANPAAGRLPIAFIHQDLGLVDTMTVAENVAIQAGYPRRFGLIDWGRARDAAKRALAAMGSRVDPDSRVVALAAADRSIVAIARALAVQCDVLVLDEPTAALPAADVERLLATLRRLRASGIGMIYVTHRLDEVFRIADRVTVLRDGRRIATLPVNQTSAQDLVVKIVGRSIAETYIEPVRQNAQPLLALHDLVVPHAEAGVIGPVSFSLGAGEILALVGLRGAGHHAVGRALFAALPVSSGRVEFCGRTIAPATPAEAMAAGIGFVSSRRGEESLAAAMSVRENLFVNPTVRGIPPLMPISPRLELLAAGRALARFSVRPPDPFRPVITLSGGNQQKVVVARWMEAHIRLLILEEPTIGVDVGSKAEIYRDFGEALRAGMAVLLISSDFEEVEKIAHRALVFSRGKVVASVSRPEMTVARLTTLAAGEPEVLAA
jgi:ribose transport system ATP-binding protein